MEKLGVMYNRGIGLEKDPVKAYLWFNLADQAGYQSAATELGILKRKMTPEQIEQAEKLSREFKASELPGPASRPAAK